jgi:hypothetical protein
MTAQISGVILDNRHIHRASIEASVTDNSVASGAASYTRVDTLGARHGDHHAGGFLTRASLRGGQTDRVSEDGR